MLENNPAGLERANIERVVGNQYSRRLRQKHGSKVLSTSGSATTADRGEKERRPRNRFEGNCFNCERKGHRAEDCRSVKKKIEKPEDAPADEKGRGWEKSCVYGSEKHFVHEQYGLCTSLEHRTRDCEERRAEKGAMPEKGMCVQR